MNSPLRDKGKQDVCYSSWSTSVRGSKYLPITALPRYGRNCQLLLTGHTEGWTDIDWSWVSRSLLLCVSVEGREQWWARTCPQLYRKQSPPRPLRAPLSHRGMLNYCSTFIPVLPLRRFSNYYLWLIGKSYWNKRQHLNDTRSDPMLLCVFLNLQSSMMWWVSKVRNNLRCWGATCRAKIMKLMRSTLKGADFLEQVWFEQKGLVFMLS